MKVIFYMRQMRTLEGVSIQLLAAAEGMKRHGITPIMREPGQWGSCDLAVCWGVKRQPEMHSGRRALVLERGYVGDRMNTWTSAGYDGLNGMADFFNDKKSAARWNKHHKAEMKPWREAKGDLVVIMGQVPTDASLRGLNFNAWLRETAERLQRAGHRVGFRPHPNHRDTLHVRGVEQLTGTMEEALARAKWVVTYNSNSGVLAVLAGVPTVSCHRGSMAWEMTGHDPYLMPPTPDRTAWASRLAWTQWSMEELRNGDFWDHLKQGMD